MRPDGRGEVCGDNFVQEIAHNVADSHFKIRKLESSRKIQFYYCEVLFLTFIIHLFDQLLCILNLWTRLIRFRIDPSEDRSNFTTLVIASG
jgi:hypothetical protein